MASDHVQLLRRPLPPKKLQPILKPLLQTDVLGAAEEPILSPWDFDPQLPRAAPTPLSLLSPVPPAMSPTITNSFPFRPRRTFHQSRLLDLLCDHPRYAQPPPCFSLNDFQESAQSVLELTRPDHLLNTMVQSHCNYRKLVDLFLSELHSGHQSQVANQTLSWEELPQAKRRIPQIICELVVQVRMELQARMECVWRSADNPLFQTERNSVELWTQDKTRAEHTHPNLYPENEVMSFFPVKYFQGFCRSSSPFQPAAECVTITLAELAVLECLTQRGTALKLKAHFIAQLPDLSPLHQSLLYLNLSFNDFTVFPVEVCELARLEVLKLRDNPIEEIPPEIEKLLNLKTLIISFCKIKVLPSQFYHLASLQHLDASHNLISSLSNEIKNLRSLQYLNVEGNQLEALPGGILCVSLSELRLGGNYTHPLLWILNSTNSPPSLTHSAARALALTHPQEQYSSLPPAAQLALSRAGVCECCGGPLFGPGLKLIHPVQGLFGLSSVPILFRSCSASCYSSDRNQTHTLTQALLTG
ncbi:uncharacterized protein [Salminus brasiliensis]|uniref:uncharacterized protein n=1 Tax=Salminus brasiliensis TaxID=930266 RepID=UPI003B82CEDE